MTNNLSTIIENLLTELSGIRRVSINTLLAYKRDLNEFLEFCNDKSLLNINQITEKHLKLYLMSLNEKHIAKSSVARKLSALRKLFDYAIKNELIQINPIRNISNPKVQRKLPETISVDFYEEILKSIEEKVKNPEQRITNKAIFELLYGCALRVSEICNLNIEDINIEKMNVKAFGKGSKVRIVPLGTKSLPILMEYLKLRNEKSGALFIDKQGRRINRFYVYKIIKSFLKDAEIVKKSPHILRHSAATHMLDRGADLMAVKEILGHENLSTTQIYTHVSIERIKKIYKQAHPKSQKE
ncbi:tyrosine-type recombinase/integrase [Rosettibacter firmus]|uniref:tyrosine-type recombinase/integrase n=1 Tax=Rosettibacter firmus TaxID=3111522 RepID=UPI00336BC003